MGLLNLLTFLCVIAALLVIMYQAFKSRNALIFALCAVLIGAIILLLLYYLVILPIFSFGPGIPVTTGFIKLQPIGRSISYRDTTASVSFVNAAGSPVKVYWVNMTEGISGQSCSVTSSLPDEVKAGDSFRVDAVCSSKTAEESFDLLFMMNYTAVEGNGTEIHAERGHIKGQGEDPSESGFFSL